jgi:ABC-2 type transport system ATP-binding protein
VKSLFHRKWVEKHALREVSFRIGPGEIVGLIGANGAGKTTLVKILSGIIHPTKGDAKVLGHVPWQRRKEFRRDIALIMGQKAQLWWDLPAADCFLLLREIYEIPRDEFQKRLDFLAATLEVKDQLNIQIRRLSLGERMKVELMAALLHEPKVVFLDEPTIGLDISAQRAIRRFILDYRRTHKPAMILTSHYMEDIEQLCERVIIIRDGAFVYDGPLKNIAREFSTTKLISAQLSDEAPTIQFKLPVELGEVCDLQPTSIKIKAPRDRVSDAAKFLFSALPVRDISIEEEDISNIIESILKKKRL